MREIANEFGYTKSAHNLAKCQGPTPLTVIPMLGLTQKPGQANAGKETYNFSLNTLKSPISSGL
jgi:hypothetical protein